MQSRNRGRLNFKSEKRHLLIRLMKQLLNKYLKTPLLIRYQYQNQKSLNKSKITHQCKRKMKIVNNKSGNSCGRIIKHRRRNNKIFKNCKILHLEWIHSASLNRKKKTSKWKMALLVIIQMTTILGMKTNRMMIILKKLRILDFLIKVTILQAHNQQALNHLNLLRTSNLLNLVKENHLFTSL